jgi:HAMP domain-containing protein
MSLTHFQALILAVAAVLTALGVIATFISRRVVRPINRIVRVVEVIEGTPAEVVNGFQVKPRSAGVIERLHNLDDGLLEALRIGRATDARVGQLEAQTRQNGGASMRDDIVAAKIAAETVAQVVTAQAQGIDPAQS